LVIHGVRERNRGTEEQRNREGIIMGFGLGVFREEGCSYKKHMGLGCG